MKKVKNQRQIFSLLMMKIFLNKTFLDTKFSKLESHLFLLEKHYNQCKLHYNKQSAEEILIQRAMKTTVQIL